MPLEFQGRSLFPRRVALPRGADGVKAVPALVAAYPLHGRSATAVRPYAGRSRFVLTPLTLSLDQLLFLITAALLAFGLIMVQSADSRVREVHENWLMQAFSNKNAIHAGLALLAMTLTWRMDYRWLLGRGGRARAESEAESKWWGIFLMPSTWLVVLTLGFLVAVLVTPFGKTINGARRWFGVGSLGFQPSELAKLSLVLFVSAYAVHAQRQVRDFGMWLVPFLVGLAGLGALAGGVALTVKPELAAKFPALADPANLNKARVGLLVAAVLCIGGGAVLWRFVRDYRWSWGFLPLVCIFAAVATLVLKEDFGTTVLIAAVVIAMILMAGCRWWHVAMLIPPAAFVVWEAIFKDPTSFRYKRMMAFMNPLADPKGAGYHPLQSLMTIMSGGFWGRGLGNGIQKMGYLPEDNTDFIFAVVCEELGFVGAAMVIGLFAAFVIVGWRVMSRCNNLFGKMVAFGITAIIGLQAAINIAVVTVSMPTKGIALPLISSGGTGWIMNAAAIGVLMSIERINRREAAISRHVETAERSFPVEIAVQATPMVHATPIAPAVPVAQAV
jgi:cell division protein FtsW (lipid II flippase)